MSHMMNCSEGLILSLSSLDKLVNICLSHDATLCFKKKLLFFGRGSVYAVGYVWKSMDSLQVIVFFLLPHGFQDGTQIVRFISEHLHLLSHLGGSVM